MGFHVLAWKTLVTHFGSVKEIMWLCNLGLIIYIDDKTP